MSGVPKSLSFDEEGESLKTPLNHSTSVSSDSSEATKVAAKCDESPKKISFDDDDTTKSSKIKSEVQQKENNGENSVQPNMLVNILSKMASDPNAHWSTAPNISDIVLTNDSKLDTVATAKSEYDETASIDAALDATFNDLKKIAKMEDGILEFAEAETREPKLREQVFFHFMVGNTVVGEFNGFSGDKIVCPTLEEIIKVMGDDWDSSQFSGWDTTEFAKVDNGDIKAILKHQFTVNVFIRGIKQMSIKVTDGTKTIKALEQNIKPLNLVTPIFVNYSVYCNTKIITSDTDINLEPKTKEAENALQNMSGSQGEISSSGNKIVVVFAIRPSDVGIDASSLSKDELKKAMIIKKVFIEPGGSVEQPDDEDLAAHGLQLPFESYYQWSGSLENITENCVLRAEPLSIKDRAAQMKDMSPDELIDTGKGFLKTAINTMKYPVLALTERKLRKDFEKGKTLTTRDFVFLRHGGELMLYKYTGVKSVVEIPALVNGLYVKYIHPNAFSTGPFKVSTLFNRKKLFSTERFSKPVGNMSGLVLPITIKYLPANFLYGVSGVTQLLIPESVSEVSPNAFNGSAIDELYFDGVCPRGFERKNVDAEVFVRRKLYKTYF